MGRRRNWNRSGRKTSSRRTNGGVVSLKSRGSQNDNHSVDYSDTNSLLHQTFTVSNVGFPKKRSGSISVDGGNNIDDMSSVSSFGTTVYNQNDSFSMASSAISNRSLEYASSSGVRGWLFDRKKLSSSEMDEEEDETTMVTDGLKRHDSVTGSISSRNSRRSQASFHPARDPQIASLAKQSLTTRPKHFQLLFGSGGSSSSRRNNTTVTNHNVEEEEEYLENEDTVMLKSKQEEEDEEHERAAAEIEREMEAEQGLQPIQESTPSPLVSTQESKTEPPKTKPLPAAPAAVVMDKGGRKPKDQDNDDQEEVSFDEETIRASNVMEEEKELDFFADYEEGVEETKEDIPSDDEEIFPVPTPPPPIRPLSLSAVIEESQDEKTDTEADVSEKLMPPPPPEEQEQETMIAPSPPPPPPKQEAKPDPPKPSWMAAIAEEHQKNQEKDPLTEHKAKLAMRQAMLEEKRKSRKQLIMVNGDKKHLKPEDLEQKPGKRGGLGGFVRILRPGRNKDDKGRKQGRSDASVASSMAESRRRSSRNAGDASVISTTSRRRGRGRGGAGDGDSVMSGASRRFSLNPFARGRRADGQQPKKESKKELKKEDKGRSSAEKQSSPTKSPDKKKKKSSKKDSDRKQSTNASVGSVPSQRLGSRTRSSASVCSLPPRRIDTRGSSTASVGRVRKVERSSSSIRRSRGSTTASLGPSMKLQEGGKRSMTKEERQMRRADLKRSASQVLLSSSLKLGTQGDYENDNVLGDVNNHNIHKFLQELDDEENGVTRRAKPSVPNQISVSPDNINQHPLFSRVETRNTSFRDLKSKRP